MSSASPVSPPILPVSRRRNGLVPACEPCRKAKVRCDHANTGGVCSRCRKRQRLSDCIVLDAPMTGLPKTPRLPKATTRRTSVTPALRNVVGGREGEEAERVPDSTGVFGSTSFSATLRQAADGLREVEGEFDDDPQRVGGNHELAMKVLARLPTKEVCQELLEASTTNAGEILFTGPVAQYMLASLFATYPTALSQPRTHTSLATLATTITLNTRLPTPSFEAPNSWREIFSGPCTRWETLGLLFCSLALEIAARKEPSVLTNNESNERSKKRKERKEYLSELKGCVEWCIELCGNSLNMLTCNLLYKNVLLEGILHSDASITVWRLHHDLVAMATALGLNCYQGTAQITMQSEMTKRLSACCFWRDKEIAMFTGRPPALSGRYYSCPFPLDVSDKALLAGGEILEQEIACLDENGWNTANKMHNATVCRMMMTAALLQDEVMELFVGNGEQWSIERVVSLKSKVEDRYCKVPVVLDITKEGLLACESDFMAWRLLFARIDYLRLRFLLERLSCERGQESQDKLLEIARTMVDLVVFVWLQRDRFRDRRYYFDAIIMCYGMPSTGVLCAALLKQSQSSQTHTTSKLPSSEVVQNLSLMIGFLEWINPSAGNYKLCQRMAKVLKKVLDKVFDPTPEVQSTEGQGEMEMWHQLDEGLAMEEASDWEWLNSIDWSRGPHTDLMM